MDTINAAIATVPHLSTLTLEATGFCRQELLERAQWGFSIILLVNVALLVFGDHICISCLASVNQANRNTCLICNSYTAPDDVTPTVNMSTDKSTAPNTMQFGACRPQLLQEIWEADPSDSLAWLSKWDISYALHRCLLRLGDICAFTYVVPPLPTEIYTLLCIDLVLPMDWVNLTDMFCAASEKVVDVANGYFLDPTPAFEIYLPTAGTYSLAASPTTSAARLQYVDVSMDYLN